MDFRKKRKQKVQSKFLLKLQHIHIKPILRIAVSVDIKIKDPRLSRLLLFRGVYQRHKILGRLLEILPPQNTVV